MNVRRTIELGHLPRVRLGNLPTPLHELSRLRDALGGPPACPRILIKRDDLTGLAFGGNKVRKLEFLIGDALQMGATTLITTGATGSNHARATAAAGVLHGLKTILVLSSKVTSPPIQGNLLLDHLLGADVRLLGEEEDRTAAMELAADDVRAAGGLPYLIPVGGSSPIGAAGYLTMTIELQEQLAVMNIVPSRLYFASGSRGTQAGIVLGAQLLGMPYDIHGILVSHPNPVSDARGLANVNEAAALVGSSLKLQAEELTCDDGYVGNGYGAPTPEADEAVLLLARTEAIFLDPVYTGKAMSALIDHIRTGQIPPGETIVFVHTGGNVALFANADRLAELARRQ